MAHQALYRKWRPVLFSDVIGQEHVTRSLKKQIETGMISHAYLFTGTRGTGKTTCAKVLARAVNCENPKNGEPCNECASCRAILDGSNMDVLEIDAASNNGVDNIREICDEVIYSPTAVKMRVYIIDEVHMLSTGAFNALLKTLEEPPEHVLFILATTEVQKIPATILSRCQRFDFKRIDNECIIHRLKTIAAGESISITDDALRQIARLADGSMRDAISLMDRCLSGETDLDVNTVNDILGVADFSEVYTFLHYLIQNDPGNTYKSFEKMYSEGKDTVSIFNELLFVIRDCILVKESGQAALDLINPMNSFDRLQALSNSIQISKLIKMFSVISDGIFKYQKNAVKRLDADITIMRLLELFSDESNDKKGNVTIDITNQNKEQKKPTDIKDARNETHNRVLSIKTPIKKNAGEIGPSADERTPEVIPSIKRDVSGKSWLDILNALKTDLAISQYTMLTMCDAKISGNAISVYGDESLIEKLDTAPIRKEIASILLKQFGKPFSISMQKGALNEPIDPQEELISKALKAGVELNVHNSITGEDSNETR